MSFLPFMSFSYRALTFTLVGLTPTGYVHLCWTHNRTWTARFTRLFKLPGQLVNLCLPIVWMNILITACACFVFSNFYILCTPSLLPAIGNTKGTSAPAVVWEALLQLKGAPIAALCYMPVCTFWRTVLQTVLPYDGILNNSRLFNSKPHPACGHLLQRRRTTDEV
jgi:hypothetical protein